MIIYILILIAYPMVRVGRGLYVGDTTYSPANFVFHDSMTGTWSVATYLANVLGSFFTKLPGGSTLLGLNIYTSLVVSLTAILPLIFLAKHINIHIIFVGEILALSLCWCPTTILYNYLTYLLFTAGALLVYTGACEDDDKRRRILFILAGLCLGLNVFTRLPNVTEAALILAVWFAAFVRRRKIRSTIADTAFCIGGYVVSAVILLIVIRNRYSSHAYSDMIGNMFKMTGKAVDYKPTAMITAMFEDYAYAGKWIALWVVAAVISGVLYTEHELKKNSNEPARKKAHMNGGSIGTILAGTLFGALFGAVIRLCYGRGMFSFRYYEYGSMYFWAVILLFATTLISLFIVFRAKPLCSDNETWESKRILSLIVLIMIYITCIGSNNGLYPIVNNLFICAPYIAWVLWDAADELIEFGESGDTDAVPECPAELTSGDGRKRGLAFAVTLTTAILFAGTFIQGFGFHLVNAFNDGINGEKLDSYVVGYERTEHIRTTSENAKNLQGLMDYMYANKTEEDRVILYGEIPGLGYILDMPSRLTTFWPDLDSYNYDEWERDLNAVVIGDPERLPYVIVTLPIAALEGGDPEAIAFFGEEAARYSDDRKLEDLIDYMHTYDYEQLYVNDAYVVYGLPQK
ncbi:MAG: hypothetical protein K6F54_08540 [Lachnospiraceae bacterium]|nr:hypothetical protein [Lachnospiraceae bacterium]